MLPNMPPLLSRLAVLESQVRDIRASQRRIEDKIEAAMAPKQPQGITIPQASVVSLVMSVATALAGKYGLK